MGPGQWMAFGASSMLLAWISWRSLGMVRSHGFYRFFGWECAILLFIINVGDWFVHPFSPMQILSWVFLCYSLLLIVLSGFHFFKHRETDHQREDTLFTFEKTKELMDGGIYRYIRHPMYGAILCFIWGTFFKNPAWPLSLIAFTGSVFLILTIIVEERENMDYWGRAYAGYREKTRWFIPFVL